MSSFNQNFWMLQSSQNKLSFFFYKLQHNARHVLKGHSVFFCWHFILPILLPKNFLFLCNYVLADRRRVSSLMLVISSQRFDLGFKINSHRALPRENWYSVKRFKMYSNWTKNERECDLKSQSKSTWNAKLYLFKQIHPHNNDIVFTFAFWSVWMWP